MIVDGRPADVKTGLSGHKGGKFDKGAGKGIVKPQGHVGPFLDIRLPGNYIKRANTGIIFIDIIAIIYKCLLKRGQSGPERPKKPKIRQRKRP
jgi:hypothetical protein